MSNRIEEITKRGLKALDCFYSGKPMYDIREKVNEKSKVGRPQNMEPSKKGKVYATEETTGSRR